MWIKNYTASSVRKALTQIKQEMGAHAMILDTRVENGLTHRSGGSGARVTVTAASERSEQTNRVADVEPEPTPVEEGPKTLHLRGSLAGSPVSDDTPVVDDEPDESGLLGRVAGLERTVTVLATKLENRPIHQSLDYWLHGHTLQEWLGTQDELRADLAEAYTGYLLDQIPEPDPFLSRERLPSSVCFVGPAGCGKSTMLMKTMALSWRSRKGSLPIVEIDGDESQTNGRLTGWAKLFDLNWMRFKFNETGRLANHLSDIAEESVFIKCTLPTREEGGERTIKRFARIVKGRVVVLVLSSLVRREVNERFLEQYAVFSPTHLCFSHWDEAQPFDDARYLSAVSRLPLAYYALGGAPCGELEPFTNTELRTGIADELIGGRSANRTVNRVEAK